jgi:hypothetical protein
MGGGQLYWLSLFQCPLNIYLNKTISQSPLMATTYVLTATYHYAEEEDVGYVE